MRKILIFILIIVILGIVGFFILKGSIKKEEKMPEIEVLQKIKGKKAVVIIAFRDFRDAEYFVPKEILEKAGVEVKTASNKMGTAIGADGGDTEVDLLISEISVSDFDAVIFVGGPGALENLDNEDSYKVAKEAIEKNKILASICISPVILAKAGVLEGKKATVWHSPLDKSGIKILEENGAIFENKSVVIDGNIITANGPGAAQDFGKTIVEALTKK
jgi:protease I